MLYPLSSSVHERSSVLVVLLRAVHDMLSELCPLLSLEVILIKATRNLVVRKGPFPSDAF